MTINECAFDCGRTDQTIRRWIKDRLFPIEKIGLREIYVNPDIWIKFCNDNNIRRKGNNNENM